MLLTYRVIPSRVRVPLLALISMKKVKKVKKAKKLKKKIKPIIICNLCGGNHDDCIAW